MQMISGLHRLVEKVGATRDFAAEKQAMRDEWTAETEGAALPALDALTGSLATLSRELDAVVAIAGALQRLSTAIEELGDAAEREGYVGLYNKAMDALGRRLDDAGPLFVAVNTTLGRVEPAEAEVRVEIARRHYEAAETEAARREAEERRKAEERRTNALAEADAALAVLTQTLPEVEAAPAANDLAA